MNQKLELVMPKSQLDLLSFSTITQDHLVVIGLQSPFINTA